jgi:hypothetical protein
MVASSKRHQHAQIINVEIVVMDALDMAIWETVTQ